MKFDTAEDAINKLMEENGSDIILSIVGLIILGAMTFASHMVVTNELANPATATVFERVGIYTVVLGTTWIFIFVAKIRQILAYIFAKKRGIYTATGIVREINYRKHDVAIFISDIESGQQVKILTGDIHAEKNNLTAGQVRTVVYLPYTKQGFIVGDAIDYAGSTGESF